MSRLTAPCSAQAQRSQGTAERSARSPRAAPHLAPEPAALGGHHGHPGEGASPLSGTVLTRLRGTCARKRFLVLFDQVRQDIVARCTTEGAKVLIVIVLPPHACSDLPVRDSCCTTLNSGGPPSLGNRREACLLSDAAFAGGTLQVPQRRRQELRAP